MKKNIILLLFLLFLFVGCSKNNQEELDSLFITNSGLKYSTLIDIDKESFEQGVDLNSNLNYEDMKVYMDNAKHYVDRNLMFSLFFPKDYLVKVYDNQIIGTSEDMDIKIRIFSKEIYLNSSSFFYDMFDMMNLNESKSEEIFIGLETSKFGVYNVSNIKFDIEKITYVEYLIEKESYYFNIEFEIKKNAVKQEYILNYFYNTILLPNY